MEYFQTKNPILGKFWTVLLVYFMTNIIALSFDILNDNVVHFSLFGMPYQEKSGNPAHRCTPIYVHKIVTFL
jgi:hypothetical protein